MRASPPESIRTPVKLSTPCALHEAMLVARPPEKRWKKHVLALHQLLRARQIHRRTYLRNEDPSNSAEGHKELTLAQIAWKSKSTTGLWQTKNRARNSR